MYIGDSDSEEDNEVLVTPTKRQRSPPAREDSNPMLKTPRINAQPRWRMDRDVNPEVGLGRDVKPYIGLGRYVKPKNGLGRDVKPVIAQRGGSPDVKPVLTAMGQLSVRLFCLVSLLT